MMLPRGSLVAGYPVGVVQDALGQIRRHLLGVSRESFLREAVRKVKTRSGDNAEDLERQRREQVRALWDALAAAGLIEPVASSLEDNCFNVTPEGHRVANATIGTGYTQKAARQALAGFLSRCQELDAPDSIYPYQVQYAVLFGSYARGAERVGDVDLVVSLAIRHADRRFQDDVRRFVVHRGKHYSPSSSSNWAKKQTEVFLKAHSPILSFVGESSLEVALKEKHQVVHGSLPLTECARIVPADELKDWMEKGGWHVVGEAPEGRFRIVHLSNLKASLPSAGN